MNCKISKKINILKFIVIFLFVSNIAILANDTIVNQNKNRPTVAIVLSGGSARGVAHIGMLKCLEDNDIQIDYIIGTSIGAVIGGIYAAGYSANQIDSIFTHANWREIFRIKTTNNRENIFFNQKSVEDRSILTLHFNNFKFISPEAVSNGNVLNDFILETILNSKYYWISDFNKLKYPFRAVATDLISGNSVVFNSGNLSRVLRASSTIPINFSPVRINDMILIDGGVMANIPVRFAKEFEPTIIIASDATTPIYDAENLNTPIKIANQAVSISMKHFADADAKFADILIDYQIDNIESLDFHKSRKIIDIGYFETQKHIANIKQKLNDEQNKFAQKAIDEIKTDKIKEFQPIIISQIIQKIIPPTVNDKTISNDIANKNVMSKISINTINDSKANNTNDSEINTIETQTNNNINLNNNIDLENNADLENNTYSKNNFYSEFPIKIGDTLTSEKLKQCYKYFGQTYLYDMIDIKIIENNLPDSNFNTLNNTLDFGNDSTNNFISTNQQNNLPTYTLEIELKEIGNQTLRFSGRLDNEKLLQIGLDFITKNIGATNLQNQIYAQFGEKDRKFEINFQNPHIFNSDISASLSTYYELKSINIFSISTTPTKFHHKIVDSTYIKKYGLKISLGSQIERKGLLTAGYRLEKQIYSFLQDDEKYIGDDYVSLLGFYFQYDSENLPYFATKGGRINALLETNLFSTNPYSQFSKMQVYFSYNINFSRFTVIPSLAFGAGDRVLPYPEFYFIGGQENFFGMRENQGFGRQMFKTSLEQRYKLPDIFSILLFDTYFSIRYDLGSVWEMPEEIRISTLLHGIGTSISLNTPIGPVSFSIGKAFNFVQSDNIKTIRWGETLLYFSLGIKP